MPASELTAIEIRDLLDAPACAGDVVTWIDAQWAARSGRTRRETMDRFTRGIARDALPVTLVAVAGDGSCAGVASLRERDSVEWLAGVTPWICNVYVPEKARGAGVAQELCLALEPRARHLGYDGIYLATSRPDSLYHRIGYREVRQIDYHGEREFILRKSLA